MDTLLLSLAPDATADKINTWCAALARDEITTEQQILQLQNDVILHMSISGRLKSLLLTFRETSHASDKETELIVEESIAGIKEWYAGIGVISALVASMTVGPLTNIPANIDPTTQLYFGFFMLSLLLAIASILSLCHVLGCLVGCAPENRKWFLLEFGGDTFLPNTLMVVSVISMLLGVCIRIEESFNGTPFFVGSMVMLGVLVLFLVTWLVRWGKRSTRPDMFAKLGNSGNALFHHKSEKATATTSPLSIN
jgi:hypothetical protein